MIPQIVPKGDENRRLTRRQLAALPFLIRDPNVERACRAAVITKQTFYKWQKDTMFREEFQRLQNELFAAGMAILTANIETACQRLVGLLDTESPALVRQTANDIINITAKNYEMENIIKRIEKLEAR